MKRSIIFILVFLLCLSSIMPVTVCAAYQDPLVLQAKTTSHSGNYSYTYDGEGRCILEENSIENQITQTYYTYGPNGILKYSVIFINDEIQEETYYDEYGTVTEYRTYEDDKTWVYKSTPKYDKYGRLIQNTTKGPYNQEGMLSKNYKEIESVRYEYDDPLTLFFGHYEQDGNIANGPEPIEWEVLKKENDSFLLISKYALDSRSYHSKNMNIEWADSDLRAWLNNTFLEEAFSYSEYCQIQETQLENDVRDRVFVLSQKEAERFYPRDKDRICEATPYAVKNGAHVNKSSGGSWWFLRTPGNANQCVMRVNSDGTMGYDGGRVASKKGAVRPVMWVSMTAISENATPIREHRSRESYDDSPSPIETWSSLTTFNDAGITTHRRTESLYYGEMLTVNEYMYDDFGNITDQMHRTSFPVGEPDVYIITHEYIYDTDGRLIKHMEYRNEQLEDVIQYQYDDMGRMISRITGDLSPDEETWTYDQYGNILQYCRNGKVEEEYTYVRLSEAAIKNIINIFN